MFLSIVFLIITILAVIGGIREFKRMNLFAVGFSFVTVLVFGFFSVMTLFRLITTGEGAP
ncbi:DUF2759 family protein [Alkalicoccobacillus porphyridii]|uniref:DUF2759 family protein n=1 Tax=Alkalicoccobacillus porphyridii TaxID=2597270 RepID=A0A553ZTB4_9BACI|nr:DUF2759 family protein [Alkalicoccobacillus porphyridii]TSB44718.1 DUF2759 family protein [Alkalicoccobacillus porphyridii]